MAKLEFTISENDMDNFVIQGIKQDMWVAHASGDHDSFDAMFKTLVWYEGHVQAFKHKLKILEGSPD